MDPAWLVTNLTASVFLPPVLLIWTGIAGLLSLKRHPRLARALVAGSILSLWALSTPYISGRLLETLQLPPRPLSPAAEADAIVILGGGVLNDSVEYGGDTVNGMTLERLRYGARVHRMTGKPILVTGGAPLENLPEGILMRAILENEFHVPVRWTETRSNNTRENARYSAELLRAAGIDRIYLVSHTWHLRRAIPQFEKAGLRVVPAGFNAVTFETMGVLDFLPGTKAFLESTFALHEWLGIAWYRARGLFD